MMKIQLLLCVTTLAVVSQIVLALPPHRAPQSTSEARLSNKASRVKQRRSALLDDNKSDISYETEWFLQPVDHFTWANQDTWLQRYLVNKDSCNRPNCPIFFYTGNEGDIEVFTRNTGFMWENAKQFQAMLVFAEHRYYGQSMPYKIDPTKISANETKTLGYLSSEQAMADFARLIHAIKYNLYDAKYSPVIALGGSYGGMLAAWMRMKYPNLVAGALAASAPILQFPGDNDTITCEQFQRIVTKDFEGYSKYCSKSIGLSWSTMRDFVRSQNLEVKNDTNLNRLSNIFNTCKPMTQLDDVDNLISLLEGIWVNMAMTDYANEASFLSKMPAYPIKHVCEHLDADPVNLSDEQLLQKISLASQVYTNYTKSVKCLDIEKLLFDPMDVLWGFQACTEMVMPICSDGVNDMFDPAPWDLRSYVDGCRKSWGVQTQVDKIKTIYGVELDALAASNIIFSRGTRDPWSAGCPSKSNEANEVYTLFIDGACHHEDLRPSGPGDTDAVKKARSTELNLLSSWISRYYEQVAASSPRDTIVWKN